MLLPGRDRETEAVLYGVLALEELLTAQELALIA